ncbi:chalcone isomerase family protein [Candidatus Accumulibacter sp. ACC003]|uniref:chalcone isomerase family protein n=1 Tax=Candidatus Accumulibacter sp. ACC003 TaxID=2823334 RepID=UPI0025BA27C3|nr:chalcone isomerase family protein [Candidatus Accumulibacter sp. ACC003]
MKKLLVLLLLAGSTLVHALPEALRASDSGWRQWGSGEMSWFGVALYRATLWVAAPPGAAFPADAPSALQLEYRRDIARERLVQSSVGEMRRLGADEAQLQRWQAELQRVLPNVQEGETIVGVHYPGRGAAFFYGGVPIGEIADAEFARAFFAIWLDSRSRSPALRAALLKRPEL